MWRRRSRGEGVLEKVNDYVEKVPGVLLLIFGV